MRLWFACYENDDAAGAEGEQGGNDQGAQGGAGGADDKVATQEQLNAVLKREKEKFRKEREKLVQQLEAAKQTAGLSTKQKEEFESQIEALRQQTMTTEERARHNESKLQKKYETTVAELTQTATTWERKFQDLQIGHDLKQAAVVNDVLPNSIVMVEALLRTKTRLVPDVNEDNEPIGTYTAKVQFADVDKHGKPVMLDLTVDEAVKRMKELPEQYGNLFKGTNAGGLGGSTGTPGKKADPRRMTTEEYLAQRKKDPASLGLK